MLIVKIFKVKTFRLNYKNYVINKLNVTACRIILSEILL